MSERDCIHGQLARSCGLCERDATIAALQQACAEKQAALDSLKAHQAELRTINDRMRISQAELAFALDYLRADPVIEDPTEFAKQLFYAAHGPALKPPSGETSAPQFRIVSVGQYDSTMECVRCGFKYIESADATHNENLSRSGHLCPPVAAASAQEQKL